MKLIRNNWIFAALLILIVCTGNAQTHEMIHQKPTYSHTASIHIRHLDGPLSFLLTNPNEEILQQPVANDESVNEKRMQTRSIPPPIEDHRLNLFELSPESQNKMFYKKTTSKTSLLAKAMVADMKKRRGEETYGSLLVNPHQQKNLGDIISTTSYVYNSKQSPTEHSLFETQENQDVNQQHRNHNMPTNYNLHDQRNEEQHHRHFDSQDNLVDHQQSTLLSSTGAIGHRFEAHQNSVTEQQPESNPIELDSNIYSHAESYNVFVIQYASSDVPLQVQETIRSVCETLSSVFDKDFIRIPISIRMNWRSYSQSNVLGSAGPRYAWLYDGKYYPDALINQLTGIDQSPEVDGELNLNKNFANWYTDLNQSPPLGKYDMFTTVLHEMCHILFMIGFVKEDGTYSGNKQYPYVFDDLIKNTQNKIKLVDLRTMNDADELNLRYSQMSGSPSMGGLYEKSSTHEIIDTIYAPGDFQRGSSLYHWDEAVHTPGNSESLMTPFLNSGERITSIGTNSIRAMETQGWIMRNCTIYQANCNMCTSAECYWCVETLECVNHHGQCIQSSAESIISSSSQCHECVQNSDCQDPNNLCIEARCDTSTSRCVYNEIVCNDSNPCTEDSCDALLGCIFDYYQYPTNSKDDQQECTQDHNLNNYCASKGFIQYVQEDLQVSLHLPRETMIRQGEYQHLNVPSLEIDRVVNCSSNGLSANSTVYVDSIMSFRQTLDYLHYVDPIYKIEQGVFSDPMINSEQQTFLPLRFPPYKTTPIQLDGSILTSKFVNLVNLPSNVWSHISHQTFDEHLYTDLVTEFQQEILDILSWNVSVSLDKSSGECNSHFPFKHLSEHSKAHPEQMESLRCFEYHNVFPEEMDLSIVAIHKTDYQQEASSQSLNNNVSDDRKALIYKLFGDQYTTKLNAMSSSSLSIEQNEYLQLQQHIPQLKQLVNDGSLYEYSQSDPPISFNQSFRVDLVKGNHFNRDTLFSCSDKQFMNNCNMYCKAILSDKSEESSQQQQRCWTMVYDISSHPLDSNVTNTFGKQQLTHLCQNDLLFGNYTPRGRNQSFSQSSGLCDANTHSLYSYGNSASYTGGVWGLEWNFQLFSQSTGVDFQPSTYLHDSKTNYFVGGLSRQSFQKLFIDFNDYHFYLVASDNLEKDPLCLYDVRMDFTLSPRNLALSSTPQGFYQDTTSGHQDSFVNNGYTNEQQLFEPGIEHLQELLNDDEQRFYKEQYSDFDHKGLLYESRQLEEPIQNQPNSFVSQLFSGVGNLFSKQKHAVLQDERDEIPQLKYLDEALMKLSRSSSGANFFFSGSSHGGVGEGLFPICSKDCQHEFFNIYAGNYGSESGSKPPQRAYHSNYKGIKALIADETNPVFSRHSHLEQEHIDVKLPLTMFGNNYRAKIYTNFTATQQDEYHRFDANSRSEDSSILIQFDKLQIQSLLANNQNRFVNSQLNSTDAIHPSWVAIPVKISHLHICSKQLLHVYKTSSVGETLTEEGFWKVCLGLAKQFVSESYGNTFSFGEILLKLPSSIRTNPTVHLQGEALISYFVRPDFYFTYLSTSPPSITDLSPPSIFTNHHTKVFGYDSFGPILPPVITLFDRAPLQWIWSEVGFKISSECYSNMVFQPY